VGIEAPDERTGGLVGVWWEGVGAGAALSSRSSSERAGGGGAAAGQTGAAPQLLAAVLCCGCATVNFVYINWFRRLRRLTGVSVRPTNQNSVENVSLWIYM
jgi:hypothetical protein